MTVFKTFLKVLNKCKFPIILFTAMLIFFGGINLNSNDKAGAFEESKPKVLILNKDNESKITNNLVSYIEKNTKKAEIEDSEEARNDALFYRLDVSYIIYIPENYGEDFKKGLNPKIDIKSNNISDSAYAEMLLSRYLKVANIYQKNIENEDELINKINETLNKKIEAEKTSKKDTTSISRVAFYYNFMNYSILAGVVYVISLILSSFNKENVKKRIIIGAINYKKHNFILMFGNILLALMLWGICVLVSFFLLGDVMKTTYGLCYIINSLIFTISTVPVAFIIGTLVNSKEAINGVINVVALGSSFTCGAFVPIEMLPDAVLKFAHILPSYWFIQSNEIIKNIEKINLETLKPVITNSIIMLVFTVVFIIILNIITRKKRKLA